MSMDMLPLEKCILSLHGCGAVKFGDFTLKSGIQSPFYLDLRVIISFPELLETVSNLMWLAKSEDAKLDRLCGVPYTALPIASVLSVRKNIPMVIRRKEAKGHGTKKILEGNFNDQDKCLILEDVIVSGSSVFETVQVLENEKLQVSEVVVFVDREQGGKQNLTNKGIRVNSVITMTQIVDILRKYSKISSDEAKNILEFISKTKVNIPPNVNGTKCMSREGLLMRAASSTHPLTKKIFGIIEEKHSNLCVAVDVTKSLDLIRLADLVGPHICILKTHIDILEDFELKIVDDLKIISEKHNFLLFEDRKYSDIGNTVKHQYSGSIHKVSTWADIVTVHGLPGDGVIQGLKMGVQKEEQGCVIVAEMSSEGNLCSQNYTEGCLSIAKKHPDFVLGFIAQNNIISDPRFILMTPGVHMESSNDNFGQQYKTPTSVVENGSDIVIVGRGITQAEDPRSVCQKYQKIAFDALLKRTGQH